MQSFGWIRMGKTAFYLWRSESEADTGAYRSALEDFGEGDLLLLQNEVNGLDDLMIRRGNNR